MLSPASVAEIPATSVPPASSSTHVSSSYTYVRGVSCFILKVMRDAVLIVNHQRLLFANRAFEELVGTTFPLVMEDPRRLFSAEESVAFFTVVTHHLTGVRADVESIVECQHGTNSPFLVRVAFHPFNDELDNGARKCVCTFAEPIFYKPLFDHTTSLVTMIEYSDDLEDCLMLKANAVAEKFFAPAPSTPYKRAWSKDLGFVFDAQDKEYFKSSSPDPYVRRFRLVAPEPPARQSPPRDRHLQTTFTYLGRSLRGHTLFTCVGEDVSKVVNLQVQLDHSKHFASQQMHFFVKMVHELRTPLSGMLGMSTLLRNTILSRDQSDMVKTIQTCGDSVLALVGNILDLSNLERNNVTLSLKQFNVLDCIEDALDIVSPEASIKRLITAYETGPLSSEIVVGDMIRLRQVLLNLLSNAIKFTPLGGHIVVRLSEDPRKGDTAAMYIFEIVDDGIGIASDAQSRIFDSYIQEDVSISQLFGGNGIGLAIVKSLVSLMGGTINVSSEKGKGATFTFAVPMPYTARSPDDTASMCEEMRGRRIAALISDSKLSEIVRGHLSRFGLQVVAPEDGAEVLIGDESAFAAYTSATGPHGSVLAGRIMLADEDAEGGPGVQLLRQPIRRRRLLDCVYRALQLNVSSEDCDGIDTRGAKRHRTRKTSPTLPKRFLIADDNVVGRRVTQKLIESMGYPSSCFYTASNGLEAVESLKQQMVDMVFMDVEMPFMNGLAATAEIRKLWGRQVKVIACTATDTKEQRMACLAVGMDDFLTKPLSYDTLRSMVKRC